jgi:hypothetical protein
MTVAELSYTGSLYRSRAHHRDSMASMLSYTGRVPSYRPRQLSAGLMLVDCILNVGVDTSVAAWYNGCIGL